MVLNDIVNFLNKLDPILDNETIYNSTSDFMANLTICKFFYTDMSVDKYAKVTRCCEKFIKLINKKYNINTEIIIQDGTMIDFSFIVSDNNCIYEMLNESEFLFDSYNIYFLDSNIYTKQCKRNNILYNKYTKDFVIFLDKLLKDKKYYYLSLSNLKYSLGNKKIYQICIHKRKSSE